MKYFDVVGIVGNTWITHPKSGREVQPGRRNGSQKSETAPGPTVRSLTRRPTYTTVTYILRTYVGPM